MLGWRDKVVLCVVAKYNFETEFDLCCQDNPSLFISDSQQTFLVSEKFSRRAA